MVVVNRLDFDDWLFEMILFMLLQHFGFIFERISADEFVASHVVLDVADLLDLLLGAWLPLQNLVVVLAVVLILVRFEAVVRTRSRLFQRLVRHDRGLGLLILDLEVQEAAAAGGEVGVAHLAVLPPDWRHCGQVALVPDPVHFVFQSLFVNHLRRVWSFLAAKVAAKEVAGVDHELDFYKAEVALN